MIKLIIFDLRKTLAYRDIPEDRSVTMQNALHLTMPHKKFIKLYENSLQTRRRESKFEAYAQLCKTLWLEAREERIQLLISIADHAEKRTKAYPHTISMLKQLNKAWYKLWIISNNWNFALEWLKHNTKILDYVDYPLFSFEVGITKPNLKIIEKMMEISWCKPEETIMIWDKIWDDVISPRELWMNSCYYKSYEQLKQNLEKFNIFLV